MATAPGAEFFEIAITFWRERVPDLRRTPLNATSASYDKESPSFYPKCHAVSGIGEALQQLRADSPQAAAAKEALQNLLAELDQPNESATVGDYAAVRQTHRRFRSGFEAH
jgi:hypothetical protein